MEFKNTKEKPRAQCQRNSSAEKISILAKFFFFFNTVLDHMTNTLRIFSLSPTCKTTLICPVHQMDALSSIMLLFYDLSSIVL